MVMDILFAINIVVIIGFLFIWSVIVFRKKNYSLFEIGWPLSLVLVTAVSFLLYGSASIYRRLLVLAVTVWGLRLAFYLYHHYWGRPEGLRYVRMREKSGSKLTGIKAFFTLFIIPAIVFSLVSLPISIGFLESQATLAWWQYTGLGLWAVGVLIEMSTEYQLRRFKNKSGNEGQLITKGFWRLTRHPHYFGTAVVWWGIYLLTVVDWTNLEAVLMGILSPIVMTLFLVYLASRSTAETEYKEREELQNYTRKTPLFFPFVSQIGAVLVGIGRIIGKGITKIAASTKKKDNSAASGEPNEMGLTNPVKDEAPINETTSETTWFKPEISEDDLAAYDESASGLSVAVPPVTADTEIAQEPDESIIDDVLADNEFGTATAAEEAEAYDMPADDSEEEAVWSEEPILSEDKIEIEDTVDITDEVHSAHKEYQNEEPTDFPEVPTFEDLPENMDQKEDSVEDNQSDADILDEELESSGSPIEGDKVPSFDSIGEIPGDDIDPNQK